VLRYQRKRLPLTSDSEHDPTSFLISVFFVVRDPRLTDAELASFVACGNSR
jgi:hypothetical protein